MEDNVLGVKQYIYNFLNPIKEKEFDVNLSLVEFSDISARKEKVYGLTDDPEKFRKWLDKTVFYGGGDLPESGYEAILTALEKIKFRKSAQKVFIFISDAPQHDLDYDGKSRYTLDRIISKLKEENISVDVIGIDDLTLKQLARGTGGQWKPIPGGDPRIDIPQPGIQKIFSKLTVSSIPDLLEDKVIVLFDNVVPDWIDLTYKVLDPNGIKVLGALTYRKEITDRSEKKVEIPVTLNISGFKNTPGVYTLIYRTKDSFGNQNILRQTFELIPM
ncbi:MAG: vWA domain-containing protein [Candidatus Poribacteria bacterium]